MKIAFTGSSGLLAGSVLSLLEADSEIEEIVGIDLRPRAESRRKLRWVKRDICDPQIWQDMQGCEILIHMAFIVLPIRNTAKAIEINIEGSRNVFNAAAKAGVKKIIYTSSTAVYGAWPDNPMPISESDSRRGNPDFYYSWSKAKVEDCLDEFEKDNAEIIITRFRPPIILSPKAYKITRWLVEQPFGVSILNRDTKTQFVWDEDVAMAILLAIKGDFHGAFNRGADGSLTSKEMNKIMGKPTITIPIVVIYVIVWLAWNLRLAKSVSPGWISIMKYSTIACNDKAKLVMGWIPKYSASEAFSLMLSEIKKDENQIA